MANDNIQKKGMSPIKAAALGAALGAAAGVGAMIMSDDKKKKELKEKGRQAMQAGRQKVSELADKANQKTAELREKAEAAAMKGREELDKVLGEAEEEIQETRAKNRKPGA